MFRFWRNRPVTVQSSEYIGVPTSFFARYKKIIWRVAVGIVAVMILVVGAQFLYPQDRSLPYATVNGKTAGNKTVSELTPLVQDVFEDTAVTLKANAVTSEAKLSALGATLNSDKTTNVLMQYSWQQRLIPFSIVWLKPSIRSAYVTFDDEVLKTKAAELAAKMTSQPKNGTVSLAAGGEVGITPAEDGVSVSSDEIVRSVGKATYAFGANTVSVSPKISKPTITNEMLSNVKATIQTVLGKTLTVKSSLDTNMVSTPDKSAMAAWIHIGDDLKLSLDKGKVAEYVNQFAKTQVQPAGTTKVTMIDGVETGRIDAPAGRGVNLDVFTSDLTKALLENGSSTVTVQFRAIAPTVAYSRTYSSSQAGLQAYVNDVTRGTSIQISLQQLTGAGWGASSGASTSVVSASTYKLFVSAILFDKINGEQIHWSDPIQGTNVDGCLSKTIVVSANNCAEQWLGEWGRSNVNAALYAKGISGATSFTTGDAARTSAADLQRLLVGLQNQTLFNAADSGKLLSLMKQQVYRKGIPAGSAGVVADKVGFLWDYLNDAAVVYHPQGTYVLVVMTKGQSWAKIAEITKQIETIMYP